MKEIRVGIIGAGAISHRHMKVYTHIPGFKVVAVAEIDEKKLKDWSERYGVEDTYTDFREMLKRDDIDSVDVCVHNNLHAPIAIAVMKAGKACYSEKPMSATYYDSKLMYDCAQKLGAKFQVQISSLYSPQTKIAKMMIDRGDLGDVYHAKSTATAYRRRPGIDMPFASPAFQDTAMAGHGPIIDIGVYHMGQLLYLLGLPELESVYGSVYKKFDYPHTPVMEGRVKGGVEDMGTGAAKFKGGLSVEFIQAACTNAENVGPSYINGTKGALIYSGVDEVGGVWSAGDARGNMPSFMTPQLKFIGENADGLHVETDLKPDFNRQRQTMFDPDYMKWYDQQFHWYCYLTGDLTDETRYNSPLIGLNASMLTEGLVLSAERGGSVTAEEIKALSKSLAIWRQETPWGVFDYEDTF